MKAVHDGLFSAKSGKETVHAIAFNDHEKVDAAVAGVRNRSHAFSTSVLTLSWSPGPCQVICRRQGALPLHVDGDDHGLFGFSYPNAGYGRGVFIIETRGHAHVALIRRDSV